MYWNGVTGDDFIALNGLTLTWDVLKFWNASLFELAMEININMRCIEIYL